MKTVLFVLFLIFAGCVQKPYAKSVAQLAGDLKVAGFDNVPYELKKSIIYFDYNKSEVKPEFFPKLKKIANYAIDNDVSLKIYGYSDNIGTNEYNKKLSLKRAEAVAKILQDYGVDKDIMEIKGFGSSNPLYPNDTPQHRAKNRRVEIIVK
ncbi:MAG: OmpA family protein [Epsilonproteobacteria bacterium]|nr:OmpA family protein [Campylobacterota bacterium]